MWSRKWGNRSVHGKMVMRNGDWYIGHITITFDDGTEMQLGDETHAGYLDGDEEGADSFEMPENGETAAEEANE